MVRRKRGRKPTETIEAIATLRAAVGARPSLLKELLEKTEKEVQKLCGANSREVARNARKAVLGGAKAGKSVPAVGVAGSAQIGVACELISRTKHKVKKRMAFRQFFFAAEGYF